MKITEFSRICLESTTKYLVKLPDNLTKHKNSMPPFSLTIDLSYVQLAPNCQ